MADQLVQINCNTGQYAYVDPITDITAVKEFGTGRALDRILEEFNHIYLQYKEDSKEATRLQIPFKLRRKGLWITYVSSQDTVITEWYNSDNFEDNAWGDNTNWVLYVTASDSTPDTTPPDLSGLIGVANGIAPLDENTKVPIEYLPPFSSGDILKYSSLSSFPTSGEVNKIYIAIDTNLIYIWTGTVYEQLSKSISLGETTSTAYPGNKGKQTTDSLASHIDNTDNPHGVTKNQVGLGNVDNTSDTNKPISTATQNALNNKVDKVAGKELSTNDFTNEYKAKIDALSVGSAGSVIKLTQEEYDSLDIKNPDILYVII